MKRQLILTVCILFCWFSTAAAYMDYVVSRRYFDDGFLKIFGANIVLKGHPDHIIKFTRWLDQIMLVPKGFQTLKSIADSGHELVIEHADVARISAGRTQGPMTMNLINGVGESVHIIFDARMDDIGTHMVYNGRKELIEYTAVQNLYHELAHAMHMMNGTWRYFASERQAIEEENIFRRQLAKIQGRTPTQRFRKSGVLISEVEATADLFHSLMWP
ncbi:MAG: M91 family zinc metallopeptidase [Desulfobacterales bacterium]|jgi:hypothetical protein|nr:hypothetical protein [Deltaproteobacteria bacterium]